MVWDKETWWNFSRNQVSSRRSALFDRGFILFSVVNFLIDEYKINAETLLYNSSYDTFAKHSLMSTLYIDLGQYLSGNDHLPVDV
jgi:hypothetical protein